MLLPNYGKRHALLRLEDISPGGPYRTPEGLGQLRAVLVYLRKAGVPVHLAVIPRHVEYGPDGSRYETGIDDPEPDENTRQFLRLMREAQREGAVLGMHGYTHQSDRAAGRDRNSGIGNEFAIPGRPETRTAEYAAARIRQSIAAFRGSGLTPGFWESPHYHDTRSQEKVFRSHIGVLFQPDKRSLRFLLDVSVYETTNRDGQPSLGSIYVPAPLRYVKDQSSVDRILRRLRRYRGLGAVYFHPFLEFPFLEPVRDSKGAVIQADGLPLFHYRDGSDSLLRQLVRGFRQCDFTWLSLHDVLPFTPAHRLTLPADAVTGQVLVGKVRGGAGDDLVVRCHHRIAVLPCDAVWPRNLSPQEPATWLEHRFDPKELFQLADIRGEGRKDLVSYNQETGSVQLFRSSGTFFAGPADVCRVAPGFTRILAADIDGHGRDSLLFQTAGTGGLWLSRNAGGRLRQPVRVIGLPDGADFFTGDLTGNGVADLVAYLPDDRLVALFRGVGDGGFIPMTAYRLDQSMAGAQLLLADVNGDGRTDVILYSAKSGLWEVRRSDGSYGLTPLPNRYGPWARGRKILLAGDFDGNGKADIAAYDQSLGVLDCSLSFQR